MDHKGRKSLVSERQRSISPRWSVQMAAYRPPAGGIRLEPLVGFWQHGTITVAKFLAWLGLCIVVHGRIPSLDGDGDLLPLETAEWGLFAAGEEGLLSEEPLQATLLVSDPGAPMPKGNFLILRRADLSPLIATQTTHQYFDRSGILRTLGEMSAELDSTFARRVRQRDRACCITGCTREGCGDDWMTFAAVHIFPPEYIAMWKAEGAGDLIEDDEPGQGEARIDSVQNGLLMQWTEAVHWELHNITVDVDDDYAIIDFTQSGAYAGRRLIVDRSVEGKSRPLDALLQGHYLQSILANLRGPGKGLPACLALADG